VDQWKLFSQRNNVYIMFTIPTKESGKYYNTAFVIGPKGIIKKHHKVIPSWTDMGYASAGTSETSIVDLPFGRFGILICRDGHSDSLYRYFSANGVKTYIGMGYGAVWEDYLFFTKDFNLNGFISDLRWSAYFSNTDGESIQNFGLATHVEPWPQVNNSGYAVFNENGKVLSRYFDLTEEERRFLNFNKP
jgi:hypothetical protein